MVVQQACYMLRRFSAIITEVFDNKEREKNTTLGNYVRDVQL
jgi:hypothetical protein